MKDIIRINEVDYKIVLKEVTTQKAILKQVSKLSDCFRYGGQYAYASKGKLKKYLTLDIAKELYKINVTFN